MRIDTPLRKHRLTHQALVPLPGVRSPRVVGLQLPHIAVHDAQAQVDEVDVYAYLQLVLPHIRAGGHRLRRPSGAEHPAGAAGIRMVDAG